MISPNVDPPQSVPEEVSNFLSTSSDGQLREVIHFAQQLLWDQPPLTDAVEARPGEELVRVADHGAYTIATVKRPDESGEARGPFAYWVKWNPISTRPAAGTNGTISGKYTTDQGTKRD